jgi:hypothetical protein
MRTRHPAERRWLLNVIAILAAMLVGALIARAQNALHEPKTYMSSRT